MLETSLYYSILFQNELTQISPMGNPWDCWLF